MRTRWPRCPEQEGFSLQATSRTREGARHPDRDAQFRYVNDQVEEFTAAGQPVVSVDTKKKEVLGEDAVAGREWHPAGRPVQVRAHDIPDKDAPKAVPYGVYDLTRRLRLGGGRLRRRHRRVRGGDPAPLVGGRRLSVGEAMTVDGLHITARLTVLERQLRLLRKVRGVTFSPPPDGRRSDSFTRALMTAVEEAYGGRDPVSPQEREVAVAELPLGCSPAPRPMFPDGELKVIARTAAEELVELPIGEVVEIAVDDARRFLTAEVAATGCPTCLGPLNRVFFYAHAQGAMKWRRDLTVAEIPRYLPDVRAALHGVERGKVGSVLRQPAADQSGLRGGGLVA